MASTYLTKTFAQAGNRRTFTISYWIKMGYVSTTADGGLFHAAQDGSNSDDLYIHTGRLNFSGYYGSTAYQVRTTAKYRDLSGWYHHVIRFDSTQSTASDRLRLYVNGELQTALDSNTYPSQNLETTYINTARQHTIGSFANGSLPNAAFNGSMSHFHFCDGYSYGADSFGETDTTTGIWKPKTAPSVTYGTNGFFLKFENSASMGTDSSGQGNNFTVNGTMTQLIDTPSNVFNTLSPIDIPTNSSGSSGTLPTLLNGNLSLTNTNQAFREVRSNFYVTKGKYYFEAKPTRIGGSGAFQVGVALNNYSQGSGERRAYQNNGYKYTPGSSSYGATFSANDIIGVALNLTDGEITFYKNGVSQGVAVTDMLSAIDDTGWTAVVNCFDADGHLNFGNGYFGTTAVSSAQNPDDGIGIFEYSVPTGYKALCTKSINAQEYS